MTKSMIDKAFSDRNIEQKDISVDKTSAIKFRFDRFSRSYAIHLFSNFFVSSKHFSKYHNEPVHEISNNVVCATSKSSDQLAHTRSLIRAFASRLSIL